MVTNRERDRNPQGPQPLSAITKRCWGSGLRRECALRKRVRLPSLMICLLLPVAVLLAAFSCRNGGKERRLEARSDLSTVWKLLTWGLYVMW